MSVLMQEGKPGEIKVVKDPEEGNVVYQSEPGCLLQIG